MGPEVRTRFAATLMTAAVSASVVASCSQGSPRTAEPATVTSGSTSGSTLHRADDADPDDPDTENLATTGSTTRLPPASVLDDPCADLEATAQITARDPTSWWTVTGLGGDVANPSSREVHVTAVHLEFEPGIPPGVHTAELVVPFDLTLAAGSSASWSWTGSILVRPFHDDAPQPVVHDVDWDRTGPAPSARCEDQPG